MVSEPEAQAPLAKGMVSRWRGYTKELGANKAVLLMLALLVGPLLLGSVVNTTDSAGRLDEADLRSDMDDPLERAVWLGGDWLMRDQNVDGSYRYLYDMEDDEYLNDENIIRQAGAAYATAYLCAYTGDRDHCASALRAMEFLIAQLEYDASGAYILYNGVASLGGTALSLVALGWYQLATGSTEYKEQMAAMAENIMAHQYPNGSFNGFHKVGWFFDHDRHVSVYAGEALYALSLMYRLYGEASYRASYDLALPWYRDYWNETHDTNIYAWAAKSGYHMYLATGEAGYADYTWQMTDTIVSWQNRNPDSEGYGSFFSIPTINTGTYSEGLGDALYLAEALDNQSRIDSYSLAINLSAHSIVKLQIDKELAESHPDPYRSYGCFRSRTWDLVLRIDYAQHAIAGIMRQLIYAEESYQTEPDGAALD